MNISYYLDSYSTVIAPADDPTEVKKQCYGSLRSANLCGNVLNDNTTRQECCCSIGAGWGDDCDLWVCPTPGTGRFPWLVSLSWLRVGNSIAVCRIAAALSGLDGEVILSYGASMGVMFVLSWNITL